MNDAPELTLTFKLGKGYDDSWIVARANSKEQAVAIMDAIQGLAEKVVETEQILHAVKNAGPLLAPGSPPAVPAAPVEQEHRATVQQGPWPGSPTAETATPAPPPAAPAQGKSYGTPHPEGKACHCGTVLVAKTTTTGKQKWQCPQWRWNNGNPNGHASEWVN